MVDQPIANIVPDDDISRSTIVILVLLTLLISVIGTWTVLSQINAAPAAQESSSTSSGKVRFALTEDPATDQSTGKVVFKLEKES